MARAFPICLVAVGAALIAAQAVPVRLTNPPERSRDVVPARVESVLRRACYDCHSNETVWPWYSKLAPVSWLVARDVREGRRALNFSEWHRVGPAAQAKAQRKSGEELIEGEMPPPAYRLAHRAARLTADERVLLLEWSATGAVAPEGDELALE